MHDIYEEMIAASREIGASFPEPRFYSCCRPYLDLSRAVWHKDPQVRRGHELVRRFLAENYGHGLEHAEKVALEAGALACIEGERLKFPGNLQEKMAVLAQLAGLLHDLKRNEKNHAQSGARAAERLLLEFPLSGEERRIIVEAIANHEAFVAARPLDSAAGQAVSDALYDADKFRWGPDNFTLTLWHMLRFSQAPILRLVRRFPRGMSGVARVRETFRTAAGKTYGPEFIDLGLAMGEKIHEFLLRRFAAELAAEEKTHSARLASKEKLEQPE